MAEVIDNTQLQTTGWSGDCGTWENAGTYQHVNVKVYVINDKEYPVSFSTHMYILL